MTLTFILTIAALLFVAALIGAALYGYQKGLTDGRQQQVDRERRNAPPPRRRAF